MGWLNKILKRNKFPKLSHEVKYAFTCAGVEYFQFADFNNTPSVRGLKTMVFYEEMRMKCTLEYLHLHAEAVDNILTQDKINIFEIKKLNEQLKQRLNLAVDTEMLYKIASIVFFDKNENVEDYDYAYNAKKIQHWKKEVAESFFLQQPLQELLPVLKDFDGNFQMFSQVVEEMNQLHLENLLQNLPVAKMQTLKGKSYFSAVAMPQN